MLGHVNYKYTLRLYRDASGKIRGGGHGRTRTALRPSTLCDLEDRRDTWPCWGPAPESNWHDPFTVFRLGTEAGSGTKLAE